MKLKLSKTACCRTPVFATSDKLFEKWNELKSILSESSPDFCRVIEEISPPSLEEITNKLDFTIWKYFNRARYRSTPYGRFAAITSLKISDKNNSPVTLSNNINEHRFTDWTEKDAFISDAKILLKNSQWFSTNSTIYSAPAEHRYIRIIKGVFETSTINSYPEIDVILKFCRCKRKKDEIFELMNSLFGFNKRETIKLLTQMFSMQLIYTDFCPNIIGNDYFKRLGLVQKDKNKSYVISERKVISGELNSGVVKDFPDLIGFLSNALPHEERNLLLKFRQSFTKKYDQTLVPLMVALDMELGIGYGEFTRQPTDDKLIDLLTVERQKEISNEQISYSQLHVYLLNELMRGGPIRLEKFAKTNINGPAPLPNSLSVQFRLSNNTPVIESIGGCTANALLGRFTIANVEFEALGNELRAIEEKANPDVVFFDIAYQAENRIDNINRRKRLYSFELPILSWSCDDTPLQLNDIFVGVVNSEIILWSKKLNKRMIPRLSSAYNYNRSDLPVYRLLCDLQHQGIKSNLNFKIEHFFPGLEYYPRMVYKNIIVSPASWLVPPFIYQNYKIKDIDTGQKILQNWLVEKGIDFPFKAGKSDQLLCFNPALKGDIQAFFHFCLQNSHGEEIRIFEALVTDQCYVLNENGKPYAAEFILSYFHSEPVYKSLLVSPDSLWTPQSESIIYPGSDWLYFELYCHPIRANEILIDKLTALLEGNDQIQSWFFIRYNDPAPHLRVRLKLKNKIYGYEITGQFLRLLNPVCSAGMISDIQIKTYFRETQRYGIERIDLAEKIFSADSELILRILRKSGQLTNLYEITLAYMDHMITLCFSEYKKQVSFVNIMAAMFAREFKIDTDQFKIINGMFKDFTKEKKFEELPSLLMPSRKYNNLFNLVLKKCDSDKQKTKILADFIHLHINRLFISDQRCYEAILYQYLLKLMKARQATAIDQPEFEPAP